MKLQDIIAQDVEYMKHVTVHVVSNYGTVTISDDTGANEDIFMQGDDAEQFISQVDRLWNELGDVSKGELELHLAKPYVDCLWN